MAKDGNFVITSLPSLLPKALEFEVSQRKAENIISQLIKIFSYNLGICFKSEFRVSARLAHLKEVLSKTLQSKML